MSTLAEKGGGSFQGLKLLRCEIPRPALGRACIRITTARPDIDGRFVHALKEVLSDGQD